MEIKKLVNDEKYIIVPDTNVLLNLYRYSPDFSEFGLQCLTEVVESLYLPATVRLEFGKHCKASFAAMEKKIENIGQGTKNQVKSARAKILSSCDQLKHLQFTDVDDLHSKLASLLDALEVTTKEFFEERKGLQLSSHYWNGSDKVNRGAFEAADGHTLLRYLEAAHFDAVTWEIVPGTTYERAILGKVDTTTPEYRAFREAICADALGRMGLAHFLKTKEKGAKEVGHER